ncbi:MAG TPA: carbohydrate porin [Kofleriaceae bacterium]|nr:carbohydrate porin [Kofleriaceae bacterium]
MRTWLAVVLLLAASRAWAQPETADKPAEPPQTTTPSPSTEPPPEGAPPTSSPLEQKPVEVPTATPVVVQPPPSAPPVKDDPDNGFRFGSYGRVIAGGDLRGGKPEEIAIVAHAPRIVEPSYLELDTSYGFTTEQGLKLRPVITLAFDGTLFHDTGEFDAHPALRNMYVDAQITHELSAWVGSRMYRGDDIYLLDYWPLDDQNIVGGGVFLHHPIAGDAVELAVAGGANRLNDPFQYQQIEVANPVQGETTVLQLNRQRVMASASAAYIKDGGPGHLSIKTKVHGELHELGSGNFKNDDGTLTAMPADSGYLVGAEVSLYGFQPVDSKFRRHVNLFVRYAKGLAAFDELQPPTSLGPDRKVSRANELTFGISANYDHKLGNVMLGFLSRDFNDSTGEDSSATGWEYAADIRPLAKLGKGFFAGADLSYQARFPRGLNNITLRAEDPAVVEIAPMLVFSPMGPSGYDRPELRLVYRAAHLNEGALDLYVPDDPRHGHEWVHFLGVQAEWWFNSTTYKR